MFVWFWNTWIVLDTTKAATVRGQDVWRTTASVMKPRSPALSTASVKDARMWTARLEPRSSAHHWSWEELDQVWPVRPVTWELRLRSGSSLPQVSRVNYYKPTLLWTAMIKVRKYFWLTVPYSRISFIGLTHLILQVAASNPSVVLPRKLWKQLVNVY